MQINFLRDFPPDLNTLTLCNIILFFFNSLLIFKKNDVFIGFEIKIASSNNYYILVYHTFYTVKVKRLIFFYLYFFQLNLWHYSDNVLNYIKLFRLISKGV